MKSDRRFDHAVIGLAGGISKTRVTGADVSRSEFATEYGVRVIFTDRLYLNAHVSFASAMETDGVSSFGYHSEYDANSLGFFIGAGIAIKDLMMRTLRSIAIVIKYSRDGYTSSSSMSQTLGFEYGV